MERKIKLINLNVNNLLSVGTLRTIPQLEIYYSDNFFWQLEKYP